MIMKPLWNSERFSGFNFTSLNLKTAVAVFGKHEGWRIFLTPLPPLKSCTEAAVQTGSSSHYRNSFWDDKPNLFGLKIGWEIAGSFVMCAALTISTPDFLTVGGNSNHGIGGPFNHFGYF
jgi:hypothetical protein